MTDNGVISAIIVSSDPKAVTELRQVLQGTEQEKLVLLQAGTGAEGLRLIRARQCECAIVDGSLPDMDALEFTRQLRDMPVLILPPAESARRGSAVRRAAGFILASAVVQKIQATLRQLNQAVEQNPASIVITDSEGKIEYVNPKFTELTGYSADEVLGQNPRILKSGRHAPEYYRELWRTITSGRVWRGEFYNKKKDGGFYWESASISPIVDDRGRITNFVAVKEDITERKKTEETLRQLTRAVEQSPATVVITDPGGKIEYVNPKFTALTGYSADEARGQNPRILKSGDQPAEFYRNLWETVTAGNEWRGEFHNRKKNGELYWESASISPITDDQGRITRFVAVKEDITQRKKAEELLRINEEKLRQRNEIMETDLRIAEATQNALLKRELPRCGFLNVDFRYLPLDRVGGDYFSFFPLDGDGVGVFIGDVAGHGVASALFLALINFAAEKTFYRHGHDPLGYLASLNRDLIGFMSNYFITGIYGLFERGQGDGAAFFRCANGGHPQPVLFREDGRAEFIGSSGNIIGQFENAVFHEKSAALARGDRVFLYTDGVPETVNARRERLGFDSDLLEFFTRSRRESLSGTLDTVIDRLREYRDGSPAEDDIILIGIEVV